MQRVLIERDFTVPRERVFAYLAEHENLRGLFGARIRRVSDGRDGQRNGVGSVRELRIGPLPPFQESVTEFIPNEVIGYRISQGSPLRDHRGEMRFSQRDGVTHLRYEITFTSVLPGVAEIVAFALRHRISRGLRRVDREA